MVCVQPRLNDWLNAYLSLAKAKHYAWQGIYITYRRRKKFLRVNQRLTTKGSKGSEGRGTRYAETEMRGRVFEALSKRSSADACLGAPSHFSHSLDIC